MSEVKKQISELMAAARKKKLPPSEIIVAETFKKLGFLAENTGPEIVQRDFNRMLKEVWLETLCVLEDYEGKVYPSNIMDGLLALRSDVVEESKKISQRDSYVQAVKFLFCSLYPYFREIFLSISQSRKTRGGRDFELQFGRLLQLMDVPYQKIKRKYRVDFMIPSDDLFRRNPTAAIIASAKRTLRERWREVVEELHEMRSPNIFLVTADHDVSDGHIKAICGHYRIHLVVWDEVKNKHSDEPLVLSYTQWANERIPILRQFWAS